MVGRRRGTGCSAAARRLLRQKAHPPPMPATTASSTSLQPLGSTTAKPGAPGAPDTLRAVHLRHETAIRGAGLLYFVGAGFLVLAACAAVAARGQAGGRFLPLALMLAAGYGYAGFLLRRLDARARYAATLMGGLGLLAFPVGTVLNGYVLFLVHAKSGRTVLSPEYRAVVAATPEYRARMGNAALALGAALAGVTVYRLFQLFLLRGF